ncbi:hypothetical protein GO755_25765 [Spirosoma sp. HMF4905]|uniref:TonB C-terminal domain-containing protein n=1 Tax=Spirosoma arboris TaxID=2682092 RepID=A0A7K1SI28_9BACT|nr:hypothetical protein [Spirosoma arboris]MVM33470.1 hypothetical protein [Spirosoma arboris]
MNYFRALPLILGWLVSGLYTPSEAKTGPEAELQQQLAHYINFPKSLQRTTHNSSVAIRFRVSTDNRIEHVEVVSQDQLLNQDLTQQLMGKKLSVSKSEQAMLHTVRLRFVQE